MHYWMWLVKLWIIQERLQKLAELPESQCGFRKGGICSDMVFTIRQLVEKSWEQRSKSFLVFVDLKKAYNSVPHVDNLIQFTDKVVSL